ncbi:cyclin-T1-like [Schistocerca americana]|uniref:cyclin-T1-like n=1 Tax=Schistocerca americana TaxID=7009 RepID=UPI001F500309|nr:cyclin-T1-like [Schistocerca americana]
MASERWYFSREQLENTPSIKCGFDKDRELSYRQQAANFIQDMGQKLKVNQLCINTAIVYMHRFYMFHSFTQFHRHSVAAASLFLAAKVEEQPRRLEHIIQVAHMCLCRDRQQPLDTKSERYSQEVCDLVFNENVLLQTLGFDVAVDHPHTHIVRCCDMVRANKDLARTSYFMASNSLHLTTMCVQYKPTLVACFCIHLACKWSNWQIPKSSEGKDWFWYVDRTVTLEQLEQLTSEFLVVVDKCPTKLKRRLAAAAPASSGNNVPLPRPELPTTSENVSSPKNLEEKRSGHLVTKTLNIVSREDSRCFQLKPSAHSSKREEQNTQVKHSEKWDHGSGRQGEQIAFMGGTRTIIQKNSIDHISSSLNGPSSSSSGSSTTTTTLIRQTSLKPHQQKRSSSWLSDSSAMSDSSTLAYQSDQYCHEQYVTEPVTKRQKQ